MAREAGVTGVVVAVIDGLGGGLGAQIVGQLRQALPQQDILALGTNALATEKMLKAGASRGASGENAIRVCVAQASFILAPIGVVVPNLMLGEITPAMAEAVADAPGRKLLLPINQPHFEIVGIEARPLAQQIAAAVEIVRQAIHAASQA